MNWQWRLEFSCPGKFSLQNVVAEQWQGKLVLQRFAFRSVSPVPSSSHDISKAYNYIAVLSTTCSGNFQFWNPSQILAKSGKASFPSDDMTICLFVADCKADDICKLHHSLNSFGSLFGPTLSMIFNWLLSWTSVVRTLCCITYESLKFKSSSNINSGPILYPLCCAVFIL